MKNNNSPSDHIQAACPRKQRLHGKLNKFLNSIDWDEWWEEFNLSVDHNGLVRYKTTRQFAKAKGCNKAEVALIAYCIGPRPPQTTRKDVIWRGDWQRRRAREFSSLEAADATGIGKLPKQCESQLDKLEQAAPCLFHDLQRLDWFAARIDEAFAGQPFRTDKPAEAEENKTRLDFYFSLHERLLTLKHRALAGWMRTLCVRPKDIDHWLQVALQIAAGQQLRRAADHHMFTATANETPAPVLDRSELRDITLADIALAKKFHAAAERGHINPEQLEGLTPTTIMIAAAMVGKRKLYNIPIPYGLDHAADEEPDRPDGTGEAAKAVAEKGGRGRRGTQNDI